ncbi:uncharacterized protein BDV17DRAFT_204381 [Aspergillus undulatus]|uniref:uncharacterized protein n=1 Tax=Aspergillus undulatus TaxID=1810928 RepID=UPI003CCD6C62
MGTRRLSLNMALALPPCIAHRPSFLVKHEADDITSCGGEDDQPFVPPEEDSLIGHRKDGQAAAVSQRSKARGPRGWMADWRLDIVSSALRSQADKGPALLAGGTVSGSQRGLSAVLFVLRWKDRRNEARLVAPSRLNEADNTIVTEAQYRRVQTRVS